MPKGDHRLILKSRVRQLDPVWAAWIGAFIEADGSVYRDKGYQCSHPGRGPHTCRKMARWVIRVTQKDPEPISALLRLTGTGKVYGWMNQGFKKAPILVWQLQAQVDVRDLASQIAPYCSKVATMLKEVE